MEHPYTIQSVETDKLVNISSKKMDFNNCVLVNQVIVLILVLFGRDFGDSVIFKFLKENKKENNNNC